ncbi:N-acetyltransferase [Spirosoma harenae]
MPIHIRHEQPNDVDTIEKLTQAAFLSGLHSDHTEQFIINALRRAGQLTISLVAEENDVILGHVAISPVTISSGATGWYGLGPISVWPDQQHQGIGSTLVNAALTELQQLGGAGCVLVGDPAYYRRFGFKTNADLVLPGIPAEYFQVLSFREEVPIGTVRYHDAFNAQE